VEDEKQRNNVSAMQPLPGDIALHVVPGSGGMVMMTLFLVDRQNFVHLIESGLDQRPFI
jgi:hypothetical protein